MSDRETSLRNIAIGDIFHATAPNGASLICLALSVSETTIRARTVTTQIAFDFDRRTGVAVWGSSDMRCPIDSVAPLPTEIHQTILGLDRKFGLEKDPHRLALTESERRALVFVASYYPAHPL